MKMKSATPSLVIEGDLTIYTVAGVKQRLLDVFAGGKGEIEVDLSKVSEIDRAGIQLMVAAKREAATLNMPLRFTNHSSAVFNMIELYDLSGHFGDPLWILRGI